MISYKRDVLERQSLSEVKMGRGSPICERVRKKIVEYFKNNVTQHQIAKALQISSSTAGVFNFLGHAPPQVCLISLAPPPPFLRKNIFILLFLINNNIIYIRNARIRYTDVHLIFTLLFTFTWNNRLCLRGHWGLFTCRAKKTRGKR